MLRQLPNTLTISRVVLATASLCLVSQRHLALWLFAAAAATDAVDGSLARRLGVESRLGEYLDQAADWALAIAGVLALVLCGWLPGWYFLAAVAPAPVFAYIRLFVPSSSPTQLRAALPGAIYFVAILELVITGLVVRAYGWHTWYIGALPIASILLAALKRYRVSQWLPCWRTS